MESDSVESLALSGGVAAGMAAFELAMSAVVLWLGAGGAVHMLLLAGWVGATGFLCRRYASRRAEWTASRLQMTNDLVENMAGHRTRMAQLTPGAWHREEDESLDRYLAASAALDREYARLAALVPQGWLTLGLAGLAPAILAGGPVDLRATAVGLGGVLLAHQALQRLAAGLSSLAGAAISWRNVAELFHAAARIEPPGVARVNATSAPRDVVRAQDIHFRYRDRGEPVLRGASLRVSKGDWVLVEGGSGGGKSTLAALLAGSCEPESGLLLARGMDRRTLGAREWRRQVAVAPQYHDNHILTESLAFNLLLGRRWPPNETDWAEAEAVCHELGLGELLERMPAGLQQVVGETGWQLSQGERSRVFMARALLQKSSLVILDESFAALDPENLRQCLECALKRAETLMVVAHP
jgi:ATP-binding cassette subfamily B protein